MASGLISTVKAPPILRAAMNPAAGIDDRRGADGDEDVARRRIRGLLHDVRLERFAKPHDAGPIMPAALGHSAAVRRKVNVSSRQRVGDCAQPCQQLTSQIEPCSRIVFSVPARSCRPSTFWVINLKFGKRRLQSASTRCAAFGSHAAIFCRRHAYHSHTSLGSRPKASAVASVSGRKFFHRPSASRNVGTPLAAETPAPVRTVMRACGVSRETRPSRSQISDLRLLINCRLAIEIIVWCCGCHLSLRGQEFERQRRDSGTTTSVWLPPATSRYVTSALSFSARPPCCAIRRR